MEFRELEYFLAIAKEGNLSHAAKKLYVGQPTLTKYIQRLEAAWGVPMFSRNGNQFLLTYAGRRYLDYAEKFLALQHNLENEMLDIRKLKKGSLVVGMPPVRCSFVLPRVLPAFHSKYPGIDFRIREQSSKSLDQDLLNGQIDIAFYNLSVRRHELAYETLSDDRMYAIVKKGHPIRDRALDTPGKLRAKIDTKARYIRLEWLQDEVFLLQNRSQRQGEYMLNLLDRLAFRPAAVQEHSNIRAALALAAGGYGVTFLSGGLLKYCRKHYSFDTYLLDEDCPPLQFVAAWRKGNYLTAYAKEFISMVREEEGK